MDLIIFIAISSSFTSISLNWFNEFNSLELIFVIISFIVFADASSGKSKLLALLIKNIL
ncbi:hypothetical protein ONA23_04335 [Mycoplasmopsis cynos]|uniref:hypothetical protein n=1 Tax=Mycoplasmopsis cynos TaxID=171284 RepID=UPI0021FE5B73|nr:hypothetical protein [Mycoplasmopsis cynos]UWV82461.1 hypothetical protein NW067_05750 [Mycoplasmopsis cynos]WAM06016.1 hypothetical protein OM999_02170 [Mycoplasmopsis cynos]WAM06231.1 hypothetical protein ONA23_04335 [Mycoplasmopsis cynos]